MTLLSNYFSCHTGVGLRLCSQEHTSGRSRGDPVSESKKKLKNDYDSDYEKKGCPSLKDNLLYKIII
jgi:hypothetical protein